jgi:hypothetical protein
MGDARSRYVIACVALAVAMASQQANHEWGKDIWNHAAAVRTFAQSPTNPLHPQYATDDPHFFLTPWAWLVGVVTGVTHASPFDVLAVAGMVSLVVLLTGLWRFCATLDVRPMTPFWALLCTFFLWGPKAWGYSGFLHANALGADLPYPSIVATGLSLWALSFLLRTEPPPSMPTYAIAGVVVGIASTTHPTSAIFVAAVLAASLLGTDRRRVLGLALAGAIALVITLAWPFYSWWSLLTDVPASIHADNKILYANPVLRLLPSIVVVAVVARHLLARHVLLVRATAILAVIYVVGWGAHAWSLGRVLPLAVLLLHVGIGDWLAGLEESGAWRRATIAVRGAVVLACAGLLALAAPGLAHAVPRPLLPDRYASDSRLAAVDARSDFLTGRFCYGDVVVAEPGLAVLVPARGGKLVSAERRWPWVDDVQERRADSARYFAEHDVTVLERYDVRWVLSRDEVPDGEVVARRRNIVLTRIGPERPCTTDAWFALGG